LEDPEGRYKQEEDFKTLDHLICNLRFAALMNFERSEETSVKSGMKGRIFGSFKSSLAHVLGLGVKAVAFVLAFWWSLGSWRIWVSSSCSWLKW
jgi:hypothetical protein